MTGLVSADMDVTALRSFHEVCRRGSISAAAQELGYTQSALSRQIAALEHRLGAPLLTRHARGVRPTHAGEVLLEHATALLSRIERARQEVTAAAVRQHTARLRVGAVPTVAAGLLPRALAAFASGGGEGVRVGFVEATTDRLLPRVLDGELDVAVVTDYPPGLPALDGLELTHLLRDELLCVLPLGHRLAGEGTVDLADLAEDTWVENYAGAASAVTAACARAGFTPRMDIECGSWLGKQAFVAAGAGVTLAPRLLVPALRADLVVRPLRDPPHRNVYAAVPSRSSPGAAAQAFVRALTRTAGGE